MADLISAKAAEADKEHELKIKQSTTSFDSYYGEAQKLKASLGYEVDKEETKQEIEAANEEMATEKFDAKSKIETLAYKETEWG